MSSSDIEVNIDQSSDTMRCCKTWKQLGSSMPCAAMPHVENWIDTCFCGEADWTLEVVGWENRIVPFLAVLVSSQHGHGGCPQVTTVLTGFWINHSLTSYISNHSLTANMDPQGVDEDPNPVGLLVLTRSDCSEATGTSLNVYSAVLSADCLDAGTGIHSL